MMNSHYKIADENKELFNSICEKYSGGSCILDICYGEVTDQLFTDKDRSLPHSNDDSHTLESVSTTSIDDMTLAIEIQKKFLRSSEPEQAQLRKSLSRIQSQSILRNEKLVVDDNIFHEYLNKASNMNSDVFKVFAKIILLSKVFFEFLIFCCHLLFLDLQMQKKRSIDNLIFVFNFECECLLMKLLNNFLKYIRTISLVRLWLDMYVNILL